jgi:hypothetical protein
MIPVSMATEYESVRTGRFLLTGPACNLIVSANVQQLYPGRGTMKKLVEQIARALVDVPEQVSVNEIESHQSIVIELSVAKQDLGKIIGRKGQNVQAIRTILNAASGKTKKRIILELLE